MEEALNGKDKQSKQYRLAAKYAKYLDREQKPYIHLYDGGLSDNLGIRVYLNLTAATGGAYEALKFRGLGDTRRLMILVVNSQTELETKFEHNEKSLGLAQTISAASSIPLNGYTADSMALLRYLGQHMEQQIALQRCADYEAQGKPMEGCKDIRASIVEVSFDRLPEEKDQKYLKHLPTSFRLKPEAVDKLRWAAKEILANSEEFQLFLKGLK
jgi:NTE family protein